MLAVEISETRQDNPVASLAEYIQAEADQPTMQALLTAMAEQAYALQAGFATQVMALTACLGVAVARFPHAERCEAFAAISLLLSSAANAASGELDVRPDAVGHA